MKKTKKKIKLNINQDIPQNKSEININNLNKLKDTKKLIKFINIIPLNSYFIENSKIIDNNYILGGYNKN